MKCTLRILIIFYKYTYASKYYYKIGKFRGLGKVFCFLEDISKTTIFGTLILMVNGIKWLTLRACTGQSKPPN